MKEKEKNRKNKFLALLLSMFMATSVSVAFSSCGDDEEETDSSTSTETEKDDEEVVLDKDELISNALFSKNAYDASKPIVTSVTGWTRSRNSTTSGTASESDSASGIIDVDEEKWKDLTTSGIDVAPETLTEDEAKAKWDSMTTKDKLEYYKAWKDDDANDDKKITDLDFYESFNIDVDDLPFVEGEGDVLQAIANPKSHPDATDSRVLMIHNEKTTETYLGTAQKFTSTSTVTVKSGETAKFSVWVKTSNLVGSSANNVPDETAHNKGAYIQITHSVGGKSLDPLEIKNINTANVEENNGWVKYEFALRGSPMASSTFSMVLGLGQSGGTNKEEYVNGFAFFDDISCEIVKSDEVVLDGYESFTLASSKEQKVQEAKKVGNKFALNFENIGNVNSAESLDGWTISATTEKNTSGQIYSTVSGVDGAIPVPNLNGYIDTPYDVIKVLNLKDLETLKLGDGTDNTTAKKVYTNYFADDDFLGDKDALVLLSKNGASYKAEKEISIAMGHSALSFFVKTSEMKGFTGAGVKFEPNESDYASNQEISNIDTTTVVEEDSDNDGWQQIFFFFENKTDSVQTAKLTLSFGPTSGLIDSDKSSFYEGFAVFADFKSYTLTEKEFDCATSGTYAKMVTLEVPEEENQTDSGFDSAGSLKSSSIKDGFANAKNYTGVYSDSAFIGGGDSLKSNALTTAGLLNKQYADNYASIANGVDFRDWNDVIGEDITQPLVIYSENAGKSYGFIGTSTSVSANGYKAISLRVKVSANAKANIYLIDMSDDNYNETLSIGRNVTYWYDKDGNVCTEDPTDTKNFNSKTDVAFKLQSNGLYKVNPNWTGATNVDKDAYFANLSAYKCDENNNLVLDDLATDYEYSDNWRHDGNDRIAFYGYNATEKSAYAYSDKSVKVYDFSTTTLAPRYSAIESKDLHFEIGNTNGEWVVVTFYIQAGESAKNYRLEVWNGARDDKSDNAVSAGDCVMFDSWPVPDPSSNWDKLLEDNGYDKDADDSETQFKGTFSFFDSAKYLRYDESLDENNVGNSYDKAYNATAQTEALMYLKNDNVIFANYAPIETSVPVNTTDDDTTTDDDDESSENETNGWLLASSIAIAGVLVLTVMSLVVRKIISIRRKKRGYVVVEKKEKKAKKTKKDKKSKKTK